jgi:hypothetical protein
VSSVPRFLRLSTTSLLIVVSLILATPGGRFARAQTAGAPSAGAVSFGPQQVFALSGAQLLAFSQQCPPLSDRLAGSPSCVVQAMQQAGATDDAIAFYRLTGHILTQFQPAGTVQLGTVVHDLWCCTADTTDMEPVLLGGIPAVVYPLDVASEVDLSAYSGYNAALAQFPNLAYLGLDGVTFEMVTAAPEGGRRYIFDNALINGCRACGTGYVARLALDFDSSGGYLGAVPLDIACCPSASNCTAPS